MKRIQQCVAQGLGRPFFGRFGGALQFLGDVEIPQGRMCAICIDPHCAAGRQAADIIENRPGFGHRAPDVDSGKTGGGRCGVNAATGKQRFDLGRETESSAVIGVVKRLDTESVPRQEYALSGTIMDRKREHASQFFDHVGAIAVIQMQQDFGI